MNSNHYPVLLNLKNKKVCVIGGGRVAFRKVKNLVETGAKIHVISPDLSDELMEMLKMHSNITYIPKKYEKGDLRGAWLAFAATNNGEINREILKDAQEEKCFCNVADSHENLGFIVPSVIRRGDLVISVSTSGNTPALTRRIREKLEIEFPDDYCIYINFLRDMRNFIKTNYKNDREKRLKLSLLLSEEMVFRHFISKEWDKLEEIIMNNIGEDALTILNLYR